MCGLNVHTNALQRTAARFLFEDLRFLVGIQELLLILETDSGCSSTLRSSSLYLSVWLVANLAFRDCSGIIRCTNCLNSEQQFQPQFQLFEQFLNICFSAKLGKFPITFSTRSVQVILKSRNELSDLWRFWIFVLRSWVQSCLFSISCLVLSLDNF